MGGRILMHLQSLEHGHRRGQTGRQRHLECCSPAGPPTQLAPTAKWPQVPLNSSLQTGGYREQPFPSNLFFFTSLTISYLLWTFGDGRNYRWQEVSNCKACTGRRSCHAWLEGKKLCEGGGRTVVLFCAPCFLRTNCRQPAERWSFLESHLSTL
jgi:hypothetical protein